MNHQKNIKKDIIKQEKNIFHLLNQKLNKQKILRIKEMILLLKKNIKKQ